MKQLSIFLAGIIFAIGLGLSGMTQPAKVFNFLHFTGAWDPSLAFVMLGAIGVHLAFFRFILRRSSPLFAGEFQLPTQSRVDTKLVLGSAIFGVGWGLAGYCPGPALVSVASGSSQALLFTLAMLAGMSLQHLSARLLSQRPATSSAA